jgi:hypothetical protein
MGNKTVILDNFSVVTAVVMLDIVVLLVNQPITVVMIIKKKIGKTTAKHALSGRKMKFSKLKR